MYRVSHISHWDSSLVVATESNKIYVYLELWHFHPAPVGETGHLLACASNPLKTTPLKIKAKLRMNEGAYHKVEN